MIHILSKFETHISSGSKNIAIAQLKPVISEIDLCDFWTITYLSKIWSDHVHLVICLCFKTRLFLRPTKKSLERIAF